MYVYSVGPTFLSLTIVAIVHRKFRLFPLQWNFLSIHHTCTMYVYAELKQVHVSLSTIIVNWSETCAESSYKSLM